MKNSSFLKIAQTAQAGKFQTRVYFKLIGIKR